MSCDAFFNKSDDTWKLEKNALIGTRAHTHMHIHMHTHTTNALEHLYQM